MYFKGIVMGLKKKYAIVMTDSGEMINIKVKKGLNIGDKIFFLKEDIYNEEDIHIKPKKNKWFSPLISVALITIVFITSLMNYKLNNITNEAYAILTIDINPSIELKVDRNKKIIEANRLNDDSIKLDINNLIGLNIDEGTILLKEMILDNDNIVNKDCILVGFAFFNNIKDENFEDDVQNIIENNFENFNIVYLNSTEEDLNNAKLKGISLGRYSINEKFKDKISDESLRDINIPKLIELFEIYSKEEDVCEIEILEEINNELVDDIDVYENDTYKEEQKKKEDYKDNLKEKEDVVINENIQKEDYINSNLEINDTSNVESNKDKEVNNNLNIEEDNKNSTSNNVNNNNSVGNSSKDDEEDDEEEDDDDEDDEDEDEEYDSND